MSLHGNPASDFEFGFSTNPLQGNTPQFPQGGGNDDFFSSSNIFKGITGLSDLAGAFAGLKGLGLAKDQFNFQKDAFGVNLSNQANLINADLSDRQARRNIESPGGISVADYLAQFGVSGDINNSGFQPNQQQQSAPAQLPQDDATTLAQFGRPNQAPRRL